MTELRSVAWISPPGETIEDVLEERGWSRKDFATRLGCSQKHVSELLRGTAPIHAEMAAQLSHVLGSTPDFWLRREAGYRAELQRMEAMERLKLEAPWLQELPLRWMIAQKWVRDFAHKGEQIEELLRFFAVAGVAAWRSVYTNQNTAFYSQPSLQRTHGAVAAWIRRAEIVAGDIACEPWGARAFQDALPSLRSLSGEGSTVDIMRKLVEACAACGVAVAFVPTPPGCPISGATRWLNPHRALLVLSLRYRRNDNLWFTFFHEAAHLLLHSKKLSFIEGIDGLDEKLEAEANRFAMDLLIPPDSAQQLPSLHTRQAVERFAAGIGVHPGIVVGRLQHEKYIAPDAMNDLKQRLCWTEEPEVF